MRMLKPLNTKTPPLFLKIWYYIIHVIINNRQVKKIVSIVYSIGLPLRRISDAIEKGQEWISENTALQLRMSPFCEEQTSTIGKSLLKVVPTFLH
jgi:hypothetical protein